ncbi:MAG: sigma-70 region 2 domain protein [Marmoricola sp.]|nr:sigma-70 region 2 domain protein [Marmoricola sp.]
MSISTTSTTSTGTSPRISPPRRAGDAVHPGRAETVRRSRAERAATTADLFRRGLECDDAAEAERLVEEAILLNIEVAEAVASRYHRRGVADEELDAVARLGLVKAARRFDPSLGHDFLSFAVPTVRGEVRRYFRDCGWMVRPPRRIQELQLQIAGVEGQLGSTVGHHPDAGEVATAVGCSREDVVEAYAARGCFSATSLDSTPADSDAAAPMVDRLGDEDPGMAEVETRELLRPALAKLKERDQLIIQLRFFDGLNQYEIAERLHVTQVQVSRLLQRIMRDLRVALEDDVDVAALSSQEQ